MKQDDGGVAEDMPPPSTQTAALLADLAAEADGLDSAMQLPSSQPLAVSVNCSDYYTPQLHPLVKEWGGGGYLNDQFCLSVSVSMFFSCCFGGSCCI